jgi:hypothetical protein
MTEEAKGESAPAMRRIDHEYSRSLAVFLAQHGVSLLITTPLTAPELDSPGKENRASPTAPEPLLSPKRITNINCTICAS